MGQLRLSQLDLWGRHQEKVMAVLALALRILRDEKGLRQSEPLLNRKLYCCLLEANHQLWKSRQGGLDAVPVSEARNPPDPDFDDITAHEKKIPDFCWGYIDHTEGDSRRQARNFVIECKRLGTPTRPDWILNKNYVHQGVLRFAVEEHSYAKHERSAAMVGYVESMSHHAILDEVNEECGSRALPRLAPRPEALDGEPVSRLEQSLVRPFPISPFRLFHFWVDLRGCFAQTR